MTQDPWATFNPQPAGAEADPWAAFNPQGAPQQPDPITPPAPGTSVHAVDPAGITTGANPPAPEPDDLLARERGLKAAGGFNTPTEMRATGTTDAVNSTGVSVAHNVLEEIGDFLGISAEALSWVLPHHLREGVGIKRGDVYNKTITVLKAMGYPTEEIENVAGRFGTNLVDNAILTAVGYGTGRAALSAIRRPDGTIPLANEVGFGSRIARGYGIGMTEAPAAQAGATVAGSVGQSVGQVEGNENPVAGMVGYGLAAPVGSRVVGGITRAGRALGNAITNARRGPVPPMFEIDPLLPAATAQSRVDAHVAYVEKEMQKVIKDKRPTKMVRGRPVPLTPEEAEANLRASFDEVYNKTRQIEDTYWGNVNPKQQVVTDDIKAAVVRYRDKLLYEESERVIPDDFVEEVLALPAIVPASRVFSIQRNLYSARHQMERNPTFRGDRERAGMLMIELEDNIRENMMREIADPQALQDARAFTAERKRLFNEGPVGAARYADRVKGEQYIKPLSEQITSKIGGAQQLASIDSFAKGQSFTSTLVDDFDVALRTSFAESMLGRKGDKIPDPTAAERWIESRAKEIEPIKRLLSDFDMQVEDLKNTKEMMDRALKSVWAQYAQNPAVTPARIINNNNPNMVADAKQATLMFMDPKNKNVVADQLGLRAWQTQVVTALDKMVQGEPQRLVKLIDRPDVRQVLNDVFKSNPDVRDRWMRLVRAAGVEDLHRGGVPTPIRTIGVITARLAGASLGRRVSNTLQGPAVISEAFKKGITGYLNRRFPEAPSQILAWAMYDAAGEAWLLSRAPTNIPDLRKAMVLARRMNNYMSNTFAEIVHNRRDPNGREWGPSTPPTP